METYNGILCVTHAELTNGIVTEANLKNLCRSDRGQRVQVARRGCYGTPALYAVESLPAKYREAVKVRYGTAEEQSQARDLMHLVSIDLAAREYYENVTIDGVRGLPTAKVAELTNAASILNTLKRVLDEAREAQAKVGRRNRINMGDWWARTAALLPRVADALPHGLPNNSRSLQRKYAAYHAGGARNYGALVSGKYSNANAAKVASKEQVAWLTQFCAYHTNPDSVEVAEKYNTVADALGWEKITARTVQRWAVKYRLEIMAGRQGAKTLKNELMMQVKRRQPSTPLKFWSLDGWVAELYYKEHRRGVMTYTNRLTVVVVLDCCGKYPIGYAIGTHESSALIQAALKNAVNHTAELTGQRCRATQLQSDNYAIKTLMATYGVCADHVTPAEVGNAKAKPIEPYFKRLNERAKRMFPDNWSGYGITSRKESQPNLDWLNAHKGLIPTREVVEQQIAAIIAAERNDKGEAFRAALGAIPAAELPAMSLTNYLLAFGDETGYKNALSASGLNIRLLGQKRVYDSFDLEFRRHSEQRWNIKYDPTDLSRVLAVSDDGAYRFELEEKYVQPIALADREEGDAAELAKVRRFNEQIKAHVIDYQAEAAETMRASLLEHPDINNEYAKSMITDGRGRNKDPKNRLRLEYTDAAEEARHEERAPKKVESTYDLY